MAALLRASSKLDEQSRLADSRLTDNLDRLRTRPIQLGEHLLERAEFISATDEVIGKHARTASLWAAWRASLTGPPSRFIRGNCAFESVPSTEALGARRD